MMMRDGHIFGDMVLFANVLTNQLSVQVQHPDSLFVYGKVVAEGAINSSFGSCYWTD
jgi:hypothetical protein